MDREHPKKLYENAEKVITQYAIANEDEIWFVIDTDEWGKQISDIKNECAKKQNWYVAQSNPSFEIWLYYHFYNQKPEVKEVETANGLKAYVNQKINGGFDNRKHPVYIQTAVINSEHNFEHEDNEPKHFSTNLHELAKQILPMIKDELDTIIRNAG